MGPSGDRRHASAACDNMNHRRADAPVGYCPQCGRSVNTSVRSPSCTDDSHARARRERSAFCVHCGRQLIRA